MPITGVGSGRGRVVEQSFHQGLELLHQPPSSRAAGRRPLLFLHGAFAGAWIWAEHVLPWFTARGYDAYALSFRGHGASAGRGELHDFGTADYVEDVLSILPIFEAPPVLIGHSMGGYIAQRVVEDLEVPAYVLMASVPPTGLMGPAVTMAVFQPWLLGRLFEIQWGDGSTAGPETLRKAFFWKDMPARQARSYLARVQNESRRATLELYWPAMPNLARLLRVPALVLGARQDRLIAAPHVVQTAALLGTSPTLFPDIGHAMMLEPGWKDVATRIHGFLSERMGGA